MQSWKRLVFLQERRIGSLPSKLEDLRAAIQVAEVKVKSLRQLSPDWARLNHLQTSVIPETSTRQQELEAQSTSESETAAALHQEVQVLKSRNEVSALLESNFNNMLGY